MNKSRESFNKKENEKKRQKKRKEKELNREERKANSTKGKGLEDMLAYVDENGNISATPPDLSRMKKIRSEDIQIGVPKQEVIDPPKLLRHGIVTHFNDEKGYGFIRDQETRESIFVHATSLLTPIKENDKITFEVERGPNGLNAVSVKVE